MPEIPAQRGTPRREVAVINSRIVDHIEGKNVRPAVPSVIDPYVTLAKHLDEILEPGPEKSTALRKLLESCDAAVRCRVADTENHSRDEKVKAANSAVAHLSDPHYVE